MDEKRRIVLIPRVPDITVLDVVFATDKGFAVLATDAEVQELRNQGIPVATLYASSQEYQTAVFNLSAEEAVAVVDSVQNQAIAALETADRNQFSVA